MKNKTNKAFTFIELMVVILLIAGLALFAIPKFQKARIMQRSARSGGSLKAIQSAIDQWALENGAPPTAPTSGDPSPATGISANVSIDLGINSAWNQAVIFRYTEAGDILTSPNAPTSTSSTYQYQIFQEAGSQILRGSIQSTLNGQQQFEPETADGNTTIAITGNTTGGSSTGTASITKQDINGYEDRGSFTPGETLVSSTSSSL